MFAQQNCLTSLAPLAALPHLDTLNVSSNRLCSLDGLDAMPVLTSLQARSASAHRRSSALRMRIAAASSPSALSRCRPLQAAGNSLASLDALACLPRCALLSSLDVTHNGLEGDGDALLALLAAMPALRALYLSAGNPVAGSVRPYRKRVVAAVAGLVYLDERPVFDAERRGAEAWVRGGEEAEAAEREKLTVRALLKPGSTPKRIREYSRESCSCEMRRRRRRRRPKPTSRTSQRCVRRPKRAPQPQQPQPVRCDVRCDVGCVS